MEQKPSSRVADQFPQTMNRMIHSWCISKALSKQHKQLPNQSPGISCGYIDIFSQTFLGRWTVSRCLSKTAINGHKDKSLYTRQRFPFNHLNIICLYLFPSSHSSSIFSQPKFPIRVCQSTHPSLVVCQKHVDS